MQPTYRVRRRRLGRLWPGSVAALATVAALSGGPWAQPASAASSSGSTTATFAVVVRSITVTPASVALGTCSGGSSTANSLGFPNGTCQSASGAVTITNGPVAGHIDMQAANAIPSDGGTAWALCQPGSETPSPCSGSSSSSGKDPGANQFELETAATSDASPFTDGSPIGATAACDEQFDVTSSTTFLSAATCSAAAGQSADETLALTGPTSSTDTSASFSIAVTWTAVP
ncbi:MAG TPA: hypothetical protein VME46_00115 [Acidimicrobiales bacterium]|nr:hypothetical protein [Acidimicrobiales bacterium]